MSNNKFDTQGTNPKGYYLDATTIHDPQAHHPNEKDYFPEVLQVFVNGNWIEKQNCFLRVYPMRFNNCDAYADMPLETNAPSFVYIRSPRLEQTWSVYKTYQAGSGGRYRGDMLNNTLPPPTSAFCLHQYS